MQRPSLSIADPLSSVLLAGSLETTLSDRFEETLSYLNVLLKNSNVRLQANSADALS
jgi:hypothetical protein